MRRLIRRAVATTMAACLVGALLSSQLPVAASAAPTVTTSTGVVTHEGITTTPATIGWLLMCPVSHSLPDDPIAHPGMTGATHLHDFTGNASTNANSTLASMEDPANRAVKSTYTGSTTTAGTTCNKQKYTPGTAGDTASYWRPALYVNGVKITGTENDQLYYRAKPTYGTGFQPIPQDARLIVGSANATSVATNSDLAANRMYWEDADGNQTNYAPNTSYFLLNVIFPSCWDGLPMDHTGPNGTDNNHFAYAVSGACPAGFTVKVPQLSEKFKYSNVPSGTRELASATPTGRAPTYTAHADFWNTWDPTALQYLVDNCINAGVSCGTNPITPLSN